MAARTGATVLIQPLGAARGAAAPPDDAVAAGIDAVWTERTDAHDSLYRGLEDENASTDARQYAAMCGHYARGVIAAPGDRLVRIIDWMLRQPGRGPAPTEIMRIGRRILRLLAESAPGTADAVMRGNRR